VESHIAVEDREEAHPVDQADQLRFADLEG
jgi:hypothetical protein